MRWLISSILIVAMAAQLHAATLQVEIEGVRVITTPDGTETLEPAEEVRPGDLLEYHITCSNTHKYPVADAVVAIPVPEPTVYMAGSATENPTVQLTCSIDGGESFHQEPIRITRDLEGGGKTEAIAGAGRYTHLRWQLPQMEPESKVKLAFRSRVRTDAQGTGAPAAVRAAPIPVAAAPTPTIPAENRTVEAIQTWPQVPMPMLTDGQWAEPKGWTDQIHGKVGVIGTGVELDFKSDTPPSRWSKAVVGCRLPMSVKRDQVILMDIYSHLPGPAQLAMAIESPSFLETPPVQISPGMNRNVMFDLKARTFKSEASNWAYRTGLQPISKVRDWFFIFYPMRSEGRFEIRAIRLHEPPK